MTFEPRTQLSPKAPAPCQARDATLDSTRRAVCQCGLSPVRFRSRPRSRAVVVAAIGFSADATDSLNPASTTTSAHGRTREPERDRTPYLYGCQVKFSWRAR